jgi:glyoxylase-like metal-dependent hydrolase (beta-lactamase superfamily II)
MNSLIFLLLSPLAQANGHRMEVNIIFDLMPHLPESSVINSPIQGKEPHLVLQNIFAFAPNRDTLGGTSYLIVNKSAAASCQNILIDAPAWNETNQKFIAAQGGVQWSIITHRGGLGQMATIAKELACEVIIQEQEAYLLPDTPTTTYHQAYQIQVAGIEQPLQIIWTPGHSPGSACVCYQAMIFTGRHLLPDRQMNPQPLQTAKTFHWPRQLRSVEKIKELCPQVQFILPGASSGMLRGRGFIDMIDRAW